MTVSSNAVEASAMVLDVMGVVVVLYFVVLHSGMAMLLLRAMPELWSRWDLSDDDAMRAVLDSPALPTVSVAVTGRAIAGWTIDGVHSLLALHYPRYEVVLVHDGLANGDLDALIEEFDLYQVPPAVLVNVPTGTVRAYYRSRRHGKLFVIDKALAGEADELNAALNASRFPYVLMMRAGTTLRADALPRLMRPYLVGQHVAAVSAAARIVDVATHGDMRARRAGSVTWCGGALAIRTLRDLVYSRLGWNGIGGQLVTDGGVILHRRDQLLAIDGYRRSARDPALDLVVRLRAYLASQRLADAILTIPDPVASMLAPAVGDLLRRRAAAHDGQLQVLATHRALLFGSQRGIRRLPATIHLLAGATLAPVLELAGYALLARALLVSGIRDPFVPLFLLAVPGFAFMLSLWAIVLEAHARGFASRWEIARLCGHAVSEQLWFRQWVMWSRLRALWRSMRGRTGASAEPTVPSAPAGLTNVAMAADRPVPR